MEIVPPDEELCDRAGKINMGSDGKVMPFYYSYKW